MGDSSRKHVSENELMLFNRIADINMDINFFLQKFETFRKLNIVDKTLLENLQQVVVDIDDFFDNNPKNIGNAVQTQCKIDFKNNYIVRAFVCDACDMPIMDKAKELNRHVARNRHKETVSRQTNTHKSQNPFKDEPRGHKGNKNDVDITKRAEGRRKQREERRSNEQNKAKRLFPKKAKLFLSSNIESFLKEATVTANKMKRLPTYKEIETVLCNAIKQKHPDVKVYIFGSRMNGLGNVHSDLDVFLDIGNCFSLYEQNPGSIQKKIGDIRDILKCHPDEWIGFQEIRGARIPILRVANRKQNIDCDFSFSNGLASCNTSLIKHFFELQPIGQKMCLFIKKWLITTTLHPNFSTYIFVLMTVFYLQMNNYLPAVSILQDGIEKPLMIGPWLGNFKPLSLKDLGIEKIPDDFNQFSHHILSFFEYYLKFDYNNFVISPYLGKPIKRTDFNTNDELFPRYSTYYKNDPKKNGIQIESKIPMCIQDPFEQNHNVAKGVHKNILNDLCEFCQETVNELKIIFEKQKSKRFPANVKDSTNACSSSESVSPTKTL